MLLFPELHPEEMLAGYVGRMVRLNGISRRRLWLELHDQVGAADVPGHLRSWTHALALGLNRNPDDIAREHTPLPVMFGIREPGESLGHAHPARTGLLHVCEIATAARGPSYCAHCVNEDLEFWGTSYWRRHHQIRGVSWCTKHGTTLISTSTPDALDQFPEEWAENPHEPVAAGPDAESLRFADIIAGMLAFKCAVPEDHALARLSSRAERLDGPLPRKPTSLRAFEAAVGQRLRGSQLAFHFLLHERSGRNREAVIRSDWSWTQASPGLKYALALTALYEHADEALSEAIAHAPTPNRAFRSHRAPRRQTS